MDQLIYSNGLVDYGKILSWAVFIWIGPWCLIREIFYNIQDTPLEKRGSTSLGVAYRIFRSMNVVARSNIINPDSSKDVRLKSSIGITLGVVVVFVAMLVGVPPHMEMHFKL